MEATQKIMYLVPWVDIEYGWGGKNDGYKIFTDKETMISSTKASSEDGNYDGGYIGPERPLCYYEAPLEEHMVSKTWTNELPHFKSNIYYIQ